MMEVRAAGDSSFIDRAKKASITNVSNDKYNWLLHLHFVKRNFETCKSLADKLQIETKNNCAYAAYIKGQVLRLEGSVNESLRQFQLCSALNAEITVGLEQVARSLFLLARPKAALDVYKEAEKKIAHDKGICYMYVKDMKSAKECFEKALNLRPNELSYAMMAKIHLAEQNLDMAVGSYKKSLRIFPENPEALATLGILYMQTGDYQNAFDCLSNSLTFDPTNFKAVLALGSMLQMHGDHDVAVAKYKQAVASSSSSSGLLESSCLWNNMAMCFFSKKKFVAAMACLKRAVYISPFHWKVLYNLALVHCTVQQYASAFHFATAAIGLRPKVPQLFSILAVVLTKLNDKINARQAYAQAVKLDKNSDPLILLNFSIFLCNVDDVKAAREQFLLLERSPHVKTLAGDEETMYNRLSVYLSTAGDA